MANTEPTISFSIKEDREKELKKTGFTSDQIKILTESESPKYKIKFKILEIFS